MGQCQLFKTNFLYITEYEIQYILVPRIFSTFLLIRVTDSIGKQSSTAGKLAELLTN